MVKHVLSNVEGFKKRSDLFYVHPDSIKSIDGWNDRIDFSGEDDLVQSIKEIGVRQPLTVRKNTNNMLELIDGERRLRAVKRANSEGCDIQSIPVMVARRGTSEVGLYIDSFVANTGKPLSPIEESACFKRLVAWGVSIKEIANKSGRSISHVRNRLELAGAIPAVKDAVSSEEISITKAKDIVLESDGKVDRQSEKLERIKSTPKKNRKRIKIAIGHQMYNSKIWENSEVLQIIGANKLNCIPLEIAIASHKKTVRFVSPTHLERVQRVDLSKDEMTILSKEILKIASLMEA